MNMNIFIFKIILKYKKSILLMYKTKVVITQSGLKNDVLNGDGTVPVQCLSVISN